MKRILLFALLCIVSSAHGSDKSLAPLQNAVYSKSMQNMLYVLNNESYTPEELSEAFFWDPSFEIAELLIMRGAQLNKHSSLGNTPLIYACLDGNPHIVELLVRHKAAVNLFDRDNQVTALGVAKVWGHVDAVRLLLEHQASVNIPNYKGITPHTQPCTLGGREEEHKKITAMLIQAAKQQQEDADKKQNAGN